MCDPQPVAVGDDMVIGLEVCDELNACSADVRDGDRDFTDEMTSGDIFA